MLIYGSGGHAAVVHAILLAQKESIAGVFDDDKEKHLFRGNRILHSYNASFFPGEKLIIAIGDNAARCAVAEKVKHAFGNAIHPSAWVDESVLIGSGSVVMHYAIVQANACVGMHCIINSGAIIEHDCRVGNFVHIGPGAILCGGVRIGENTLIGAGSIVNPGIQVGKNCIVGSGSVVTRDIPDCVIAAGNPARILKQNHTR